MRAWRSIRRPFQSRRSPLIWMVHGKRLDGFHNEDIPSPPLDYDNEKDVARLVPSRHHASGCDVDYNGSVMPPPDAVAGKDKGPDGKLIKVAAVERRGQADPGSLDRHRLPHRPPRSEGPRMPAAGCSTRAVPP